MTLSAKAVFLMMAVGLSLAAGSIPAETTVTDAWSRVGTTSDTALATVTRAIAARDTVLLASAFPEKVLIAMPRGKNLAGRADIIKYSPMLFDKFGGCDVLVSREQVEWLKDKQDMIREAGLVAITRSVENQVDTVWSGAYTVYWLMTDSTWTMYRFFVGHK